MGWGSAGIHFYPVADALIEAGADDDTRYKVCKALIRSLQNGDWDTEGESLGLYTEDEAIVRAFRECGVVVPCEADNSDVEGSTEYLWCEEERNHEGKHRDYNGTEF